MAAAMAAACCSEHCWYSIIPAAVCVLVLALLEPGIPLDCMSQRWSRAVLAAPAVPSPAGTPTTATCNPLLWQFQGYYPLFADNCGGGRQRGGTGASRV
jgi:hypothetical protein